MAELRISASGRVLALLLPLLALPLLMCGQATVVTPAASSPVARQSGAGGTGGGPGGGPASVKWSACSTGDCLINERVQTTPLASAASATVSASCHADERMLSGGYVIEHASSDVWITASYPSDMNSWTVSAYNASSTAATLDADVNCVHVDAASAQMNLPTPAQTTVPTGTTGSVAVACPAGLVPTGGGFQVALAGSAFASPAHTTAKTGAWLATSAAPALPASGVFNPFVTASQPQTSGWQVGVYTPVAAATVSAYVVCWNATNWSTIADGEHVPAGGTASAQAETYNCPANTTLVGGGFTTSDATGGMLRFASSGDNLADTVLGGWNAVVINTDAATAHGFSAVGICAA